jgi:hypothetical protein
MSFIRNILRSEINKNKIEFKLLALFSLISFILVILVT